MTVTSGCRLVSSFLAALTTVVVMHTASVLVFFVSQQCQSAVLTQVSDYYFRGSLFAFLLVFVFAIVGALRQWWTALIIVSSPGSSARCSPQALPRSPVGST